MAWFGSFAFILVADLRLIAVGLSQLLYLELSKHVPDPYMQSSNYNYGERTYDSSQNLTPINDLLPSLMVGGCLVLAPKVNFFLNSRKQGVTLLAYYASSLSFFLLLTGGLTYKI